MSYPLDCFEFCMLSLGKPIHRYSDDECDDRTQEENEEGSELISEAA